MCDDFHGQIEREVFTAGMQEVFPDRPIVDIPNGDGIYDDHGRLIVLMCHKMDRGDSWEPVDGSRKSFG